MLPNYLSAAAGDFIKIEIAEEGIYKITYDDLKAKGVGLKGINPNTINLYNKGKSVAIFVSGAEDLHFDKDDSVEFYGELNKSEFDSYDQYSKKNIYCLYLEDTNPPVRYSEVDSSDLSMIGKVDFQKEKGFSKKVRYEENNQLEHKFVPFFESQKSDYNFWRLVSSKNNEFKEVMMMPNLDSKAEITINVKAFGKSSYNFSPDHFMTVYINDIKIGENQWDGKTENIYSQKFKITNFDSVNPWENKIRITGSQTLINTVKPESDLVLLDFIDVNYYLKSSPKEDKKITLHLEKNSELKGINKKLLENKMFWYALDPDLEAFYKNIDLPDIDKEKEVELSFSMLGGIKNQPDQLNHHVIFELNGKAIDDIHFGGTEEYIHKIKLPGKSFKQAMNVIKITTPGDESIKGKSSEFVRNFNKPIKKDIVIDEFYIDWVEFEYNCTNLAENNYIDCYTKQNQKTKLLEFRNFFNNNISVYDVINNKKIKPYISEIISEESTEYSIHFFENAEIQSHYFALADEKKKKPFSIEKSSTMNLKAVENEGELVIISPQEFLNQSNELAKWKESQGLKTKVVEIKSIYDEFNNGLKHPQAIKNFLTFAYKSWKVPPKYVILVGNTLWDFNNAEKRNIKDFMPTYYIQNPCFESYAYDNWYGCFNGSMIPQIAVGRFPVSTAEQMNTIVDKIIKYESFTGEGDWRTNVHFVSNDEALFSDQIEFLDKAYFTPIFKVTKETSAAETVLANYTGSLFLSFYGKGDENFWIDKKVYTKDNLNLIQNVGYKSPVVFAASSKSALFDTNSEELTLGESWLLMPQKGAISYIGQTFTDDIYFEYPYYRKMMEWLLNNKDQRLGDAFVGAMKNFNSDDYSISTTLLGDPSLKVSFPPLKIDVDVKGEYSINNEYDINGSIDQKLDGSAKIVVYTKDGDEIFYQTSPMKNGKFSFKFKVPLTANNNEEAIWKCTAWSIEKGSVFQKEEFKTYLDGLAWGRFKTVFPKQ